MKLVELLAEKIKEWPHGAKNITQDHDGSVSPCTDPYNDLEFDGSRWSSTNGFHMGLDIIGKQERASDYKTAIITRAQWQAERDRQKGGEWKRHRGGRQPVDAGQIVGYKLRGGECGECLAGHLMWDHQKDESDVMQYRVISQPQAEELDVKDTTIGTLSYKVEIDTTEASQAINDLAAKWDQIDGPLLWRDTVNELDAYIDEFTREREALINRLALEGFSLLPAMHLVMGVADYAPKFCDWMVGDIVEVINISNFVNSAVKVGDQYPISYRDSSDVKGPSGTFGGEDNYKFIRRP